MSEVSAEVPAEQAESTPDTIWMYHPETKGVARTTPAAFARWQEKGWVEATDEHLAASTEQTAVADGKLPDPAAGPDQAAGNLGADGASGTDAATESVTPHRARHTTGAGSES